MITKEDLLRELEELPTGWQDFLHKMVDELYEEIVKSNLEDYCVEQSKEKFGELRWYDYGGNEATEAIVDKYCDLSTKVCYDCGAPATGHTNGWITFVCDKHKR